MNRRIIAMAATGIVIVGAGAAAAATSSASGSTTSDYTATAATRILDTRNAIGAPVAAVKPGAVLVLTVAGIDSIPAGVTAVTLNVTVTQGTSNGFVSAYADGSQVPATSTLNYAAGQTVANNATVQVGADGKVDFHNASKGSVELIADLEGYYTPTAAAYVAPTTISQTLPGVASVNTGGSFNSRATQVGTVDLPAGSYLVTMSAKATPIVQSDATVQVFPSVHLYNQPTNPSFTGDVLDVGNGALESGAYTAADGYYSNSGVVTLTQDTTMIVYAFGYDSNDGEGTYQLDGVTITATPVSTTGN